MDKQTNKQKNVMENNDIHSMNTKTWGVWIKITRMYF